MSVSTNINEYISVSKTAAMLGWTTETLRRYRKSGKGPAGYIKTSDSHGVYPLDEVISFQQQRLMRRKQ